MNQEEIKQTIHAIQRRNAAVEADKAWERSLARKLLVCSITYVTAGLMLEMAEMQRPWISALIPTIGFYLSTLTLPFVKRRWLKKRHYRETA